MPGEPVQAPPLLPLPLRWKLGAPWLQQVLDSPPPAGGGGGTITKVQSATPTQSAVSGTTLTVTLPSDVTVGDHIIVFCGYSGGLGVTVAVTDAAGNSYTTDVTTDDGNTTAAYSAIASAKCTTALTAGQTIT